MQQIRLTRSSQDKMIAGVCGGIARYLNIDPLFVRILFGILMLGGEGFIIYGILWLALPQDTELEADENTQNIPRLTRPQEGRQVAGVCAGLAEHFRFDVRLVRLLFVLAALSGGTGLLLYVLLTAVIPEEEDVAKDKPKQHAA